MNVSPPSQPATTARAVSAPCANMNHWIHVTMPRSEMRLMIFQVATVQGTLRVGELRKDSVIQSIYWMAAERMEMTTEAAEPPANAP